jgi:hypothetical protein
LSVLQSRLSALRPLQRLHKLTAPVLLELAEQALGQPQQQKVALVLEAGLLLHSASEQLAEPLAGILSGITQSTMRLFVS